MKSVCKFGRFSKMFLQEIRGSFRRRVTIRNDSIGQFFNFADFLFKLFVLKRHFFTRILNFSNSPLSLACFVISFFDLNLEPVLKDVITPF